MTDVYMDFVTLIATLRAYLIQPVFSLPEIGSHLFNMYMQMLHAGGYQE